MRDRKGVDPADGELYRKHAYDADGTLIGTVDGPRVNGDDVGMSPTGAG